MKTDSNAIIQKNDIIKHIIGLFQFNEKLNKSVLAVLFLIVFNDSVIMTPNNSILDFLSKIPKCQNKIMIFTKMEILMNHFFLLSFRLNFMEIRWKWFYKRIHHSCW